jgi:hypothetical protein
VYAIVASWVDPSMVQAFDRIADGADYGDSRADVNNVYQFGRD